MVSALLDVPEIAVDGTLSGCLSTSAVRTGSARPLNRWGLFATSAGGMRYHSDTVTESGHLLASSNRLRSQSAMHNLNARLLVIGSLSSRRRRGSTGKHDNTLTDILVTMEWRSSAVQVAITLSTQNTAFFTIFLAAPRPRISEADVPLPTKTCLDHCLERWRTSCCCCCCCCCCCGCWTLERVRIRRLLERLTSVNCWLSVSASAWWSTDCRKALWICSQ